MKRDYGIDLLKMMAMTMVVAHHILNTDAMLVALLILASITLVDAVRRLAAVRVIGLFRAMGA